ncbi:MAG: S26 family signal peptidase [Planctomycetota bacterium]
MAPTFQGPGWDVQCSSCRHQWRQFVFLGGDMSPGDDAPKRQPCPNCGTIWDVDKIRFNAKRVSTAVRWDARPKADFQRGDVIVLADEASQGMPRVKRILGVPGDTIDAHPLPSDHVAAGHVLQLVINGQSPLKRIPPSKRPWVHVYRDSTPDSRFKGERWTQRKQSRNTGPEDATPRIWTGSLGDWLMYSHFQFRGEHAAASPIMDDYAGNLNVSRPLVPAAHVRVSLHLDKSAFRHVTGLRIQMAFCDAEGTRSLFEREIRKESHNVQIDTLESLKIESDQDSALQQCPIDRQHPIAIRILPQRKKQTATSEPTDQIIAISNLCVQRGVRYWVDAETAAAWPNPLCIEDGCVFVLGDNVPVSIDDRQRVAAGAKGTPVSHLYQGPEVWRHQLRGG